MNYFTSLLNRLTVMLVMGLSVISLRAQVNPTVPATTKDHDKAIIAYFTQYDAWKATAHGFPAKGTANQLNVDYSQYTIMNFSFFGVAEDGSLHSGDLRNQQIYMDGVNQEPGELLHPDAYSSWDYWLLFGELELLHYLPETHQAYLDGYRVDGTSWTNINNGLSGQLPIPYPKEGGAPGLLKLAKENGVKVVASIGGWSMCKHFPEVAADPVKRQRFLDDCENLMALGFDGIDIDWEFPGPFAGMNFTGSEADYKNFTDLMVAIRETVGPDAIVSAAFNQSASKLAGLEWDKLDAVMDYFNMMTYDMHGGWSNIAGHNSPLYSYDGEEYGAASWDDTFKYLTQTLNVKPSKINMGVGFYGRGVVCDGTAALNAPTKKEQRTVQPDGPILSCADYTNFGGFDGTPNYQYVKTTTTDWEEHWDDQAKVPYKTKGNFFVSYDNERSIEMKAQYVVDNNAAGVIIWQIYGDWDATTVTETYASKLPYCADTKAPLANVLNEVFANGSGDRKPTVAMVSPADGAQIVDETLSAIEFSATASDAEGLSGVAFVVGTDTIAANFQSGEYKANWTPTAYGTFTVEAIATDNAQQTAKASASFTVSESQPKVAPVVSIDSPADGTIVKQTALSAINLAASATDTDGTVAELKILIDGQTFTSGSTSWTPAAFGTYTMTAIAVDNDGLSDTAQVSFEVKEKVVVPAGDKVVVGYWQNWNLASSPYIRLRDVDSRYNVVNISFAEPVQGSASQMFFEPDPKLTTKDEFKADVAQLQAEGRKVIISIGGANAHVDLSTTAARDEFVSSMTAIIQEYGFDGLDIDLEGGSLSVDAGDSDFKNPTTPKVVNFIDAVQAIAANFGTDFMLTAAPETAYVQGGYANYGGIWGGYLPVLYALHDDLDILHVQLYNTGSVEALDGKAYSSATSDFIVAMTEMLLQGFPVGRNTQNMFPAFRADQVAIGLPATPPAAPSGGYCTPQEMEDAWYYLTAGQAFGGTYQMISTTGYPELRGFMTWSVNWDATSSNAYVAKANELIGGTVGNRCPQVTFTAPVSTSQATLDPVTVSFTATDADNDAVSVSATLDGQAVALNNNSFTFTPATFKDYVVVVTATDGECVKTETLTVSVSEVPPCDVPLWSADEVYAAGGTQVQYNGKVYANKWWVDYRDVPGESSAWEYIEDCGAPVDLAPVISFTAPTAASTIEQATFEPVAIAFSVTDDSAVASVSVTVNGAAVTPTQNGTDYTFSYTPTAYGAVTVVVSAVDDIQQTAEKTLNFSIAQPVDDPPVVAWVSPADGAVVAQDVLSAVELLISATDDSALSAVQITVDGQTVTATALGNNQYAVQFTPAAFGSYIATASATDDNDQTTDVAITFEIKENTVTDCGDIPAWDPDYEYPSGGGAEVNYEGAIYISKWWTKGDVPGADQWGPWEYVSDCDAKKAQRIQSLNAIIGVYPNPADDFIQIRLADDVQIDHVYFYDLKGKQLLHKTLKAASGTQRIDISALAKGQYILKIVADQLTFQQQIIKQ